MTLRLAIVMAGVLVGCHSALPPEDVKDLENAARTSAAAYRHASDGGPEGALIRATYCSVSAVIRDQKLDGYDGGVLCQ